MPDQLGTQLVQKISALIADLLVQSRNHQPGLAMVATAVECAAERLLCASEFPGLDAIPARVRVILPRDNTASDFSHRSMPMGISRGAQPPARAAAQPPG